MRHGFGPYIPHRINYLLQKPHPCPLDNFSTVSDFAENLELLQPSNPRRGATLGRAGSPSIKLLLVKHSFYERWSGFPMRFQFDCGRRMSNSRVGFGSSPGT